MGNEHEPGRSTVRDIADVLRRHGVGATGGRPAEEVARVWAEAGFDDPEEVDGWLRARCLTPEGARALDHAGLTPEQAALRTRAGASGEEDTLGHKLTRGDLSLEEARRIITSEFWDS